MLDPSATGNVRFRNRRLALGLSQDAMMVLAKCGKDMLVRIERYGYRPGDVVCAKLAKALDTTADELFGPKPDDDEDQPTRSVVGSAR